MLSWFSRAKDSSPLSHPSRARKFAAELDSDPLVAAERVGALLRNYVIDIANESDVEALPLLELDNQVRDIPERLEADLLAAASPAHPMHGKLWDAGYDWAMRFADCYRMVLLRQKVLSIQSKRVDELVLTGARFFAYRNMAYRYRLYRHEEWQPGVWQDTNQVFSRICDLGIDHIVVTTTTPKHPEPIVNYAARSFLALLILRLCNNGATNSMQVHTLYRKIYDYCYDVKMTARPTVEGCFAIDLSSAGGLKRTNGYGTGGHHAYCDLSAVYARMVSWLDKYTASEKAQQANVFDAETAYVLRGAVSRLDAESKPVPRASQRTDDEGRLCATFAAWKVVKAINFEASVIPLELGGEAYSYADAEQIHMFGAVVGDETRRVRRDLPPEAIPLNFKFWYMRDRSDTGYRVVVPIDADQSVRLQDIVILTEDSPASGWQIARVVRQLKQVDGMVELGLQVLSRDVEGVELRTLRNRPGSFSKDYSSMITGKPFKVVRLKSAFLGNTPIMEQTLILPLAEYQTGMLYELFGAQRRFTLGDVITQGTDWVWVRPVEQ